MAQREIDSFLRKNKGKFFTLAELAEALSISKSSIARALRQMRKYNSIGFRELEGAYGNARYVYGYEE